MRRPVVRLLFWGAPKGVSKWPTVGFDTERRAREIASLLKEKVPDFIFVGGQLVSSAKQAKDVVESLGSQGETCTVIFHLASGWFSAGDVMRKLPTVVVSDPYLWGYAGMITHSHNLRSEGVRGFLVSSSNWKDVERAFNVVKAYDKLCKTRILVVGRRVLGAKPEEYEAALKSVGVKLIFADFMELKDEYDKIHVDEAEKLADELMSHADKVIEPTKEDVICSVRLYYAIKRLCEKYEATGVTMDCLGGFARGDLPAYPCIAFALLDDEGEVMTACECDVNSLLTKIAVKEIAERPSFVCEPAIDTCANVAIYAHCTAPLRMRGFSEMAEDYWIRSHAEDDKGATFQVLMRGGGPATAAKLIPTERRLLLLKGEFLGHEEREGGCRDKAVVRVADAQRLIDCWQHNWHRVLSYGDWTRELIWLAKILGFDIHVEAGSLPI